MMEYSYVVTWSMHRGWQIDWEATQARFPEGNLYIPNLDTWTPTGGEGTESYVFETVITDELTQIFDAMREKS
jgi:hypothetical protein